MSDGWISFWGSIIGGMITFIGVVVTLIYYKKKGTKEEEQIKIKNAKIFYYFILAKLSVIKNANDTLKADAKQINVVNNIICSNEDKLFAYQYLIYVQECLNDSDVRELGAFIEQLAVVESFREDSITDINNGGGIAKADQSQPVDYSNQRFYKESVRACMQLLNGGEDSKGTIKILDDLERIVVNGE